MSSPLTTLELAAGELRLDGTPTVLLCSSVFPFRLPVDQWEDRLRLVRESGYRMIDVYVHWGYHEQEPGQIDLTSPERDLARFLDLAAAQDLLVMARPGPYICSETDGGGLPWWLHGDAPGAPRELRTTDPDYLAAVDRWFAAVMPILAGAQLTRGGPVALVQLENELDFFDCPDPDAYMTHLADRAREAGIEVPLIACAGQGDVAGASGEADGVVPTVNLYPPDDSPAVDEATRYASTVLHAQGLPLMVTETNRLHLTLRREILAGARLVAPYLQAGGFDHLVLPSAGNWGDPGNLMAHYYDFAGYLSPEGLRRPEYDAAIALSSTLDAWGERLAAATPIPLADAPVSGAAAGGALALPGGGHLVGPAALGERDATVRLEPTGSEPVEVTIPAGTCPFLPVGVPLDAWGVSGVLEAATGELVGVEPAEGGTPLLLTVAGDASTTVRVRLGADNAAGDGGEVGEALALTGHGEVTSTGTTAQVTVRIVPPAAPVADPAPLTSRAAAELLPLDADALAAGTDATPSAARERALPGAEALGLADGRLQAEVELSAEAQELLLLGAADLVRLEIDGTDHGVQIAFGSPLSHPLQVGRAQTARLTAEIWGRANFDDARRPALRLGAGRGLGTVLEVLAAEDIADLWEVRRIPDRRGNGPLAIPPLRTLGGWSSAQPGRDTVYGRRVGVPGGDEIGVLRLHGLGHPVHVRVAGGEPQLLVPEAPVLLLDGVSGEVDLEITAPHVPGGLVTGVELLRGRRPAVTALRTRSEAELAAAVTAAAALEAGPDRAVQPVREALHVSAPALVRLAEPVSAGAGMLLDVAGQDVEVTVLCGGRRVSRHVLGGAVVSGGDPVRSWIPAGRAGQEDAEVLLLIEPLTAQGGIFREVRRALTDR